MNKLCCLGLRLTIDISKAWEENLGSEVYEEIMNFGKLSLIQKRLQSYMHTQDVTNTQKRLEKSMSFQI